MGCQAFSAVVTSAIAKVAYVRDCLLQRIKLVRILIIDNTQLVKAIDVFKQIMSSMDSTNTKSQRPRSRKSIAHMPSPDITNKENATIDSAGLAPIAKAARKKSRSKSIGPGGLDALQEGSGNRREVR